MDTGFFANEFSTPAQAVQIDHIWGDDDERQTLAHAHDGNGSALTFRLSRNGQRPRSLASRVVARFHELLVTNEDETFPTRSAMRSALHDAALKAWPHCVSAAAPFAVVDIDDDDEGRIEWHVSNEVTLYQQFLNALSPAESLLTDNNTHPTNKHIDQQKLAIIHRLPGRGTSAVVRVKSLVEEHNSVYVLKGINFGDFLASRAEFTHNRDVLYHSIQTLLSMPPHPNILSAPDTFAVTQYPGDKGPGRICGTLYPFMGQGTLDDQVARRKRLGGRLSLRDKGRWFLQMCSAVAHTHYKAHSYHMDIKPANILVDDLGNAVLIDWEQSGAPRYTLAPEANGEWDVDEVDGMDVSRRLVYTRYCGKARMNLTRGWPTWNVFPEWSRRWPRACEAAEVFSLGYTMWMLLQEVLQEDVENCDPGIINLSWDEAGNDIPEHWKAVVMRSLKDDPNERILLSDLVLFWEGQQISI